jgi:hypothetical protein
MRNETMRCGGSNPADLAFRLQRTDRIECDPEFPRRRNSIYRATLLISTVIPF